MYPNFDTTTFAAEGLRRMKEGYLASRTLPSFINENFNAGLANEEIESVALVNSIKDDEYFAADEFGGEKRSLSETGLDSDFLGNVMLRKSLGFLSDKDEMFLGNYADNTKPSTKNNFLKIMRGDTDEVLKQLKDKESDDDNFEVFSYFIPTLDPDTGTYKLKEVVGTKEAMAKVELAGSSIINSYGPKKFSENPLISFGKGFVRGIHDILPGLYSFAAGVGDMAEATANLVKGNGFVSNYDSLNALADYRTDEVNQDVIYGTTTTQSEKGLLDNWEGFANTVGQVVSSLTGYGVLGRAIAGTGIGGLLGGFAAEGKAAETLGSIAKTLNTALAKAPTAIPMLGAGMIMNYGEGYQAARQAGLSLEDAASVGMAVGAVNTFIEQKLGSNVLNRWLATGKSGEEAAKAIIRETGGDMSKLFDRGISNKILNSVMNTVDRITATGNKIGFGTMFEEGLEEFLQAQGKNSIEMLYDRFVAPDDVEIGKGKFGTDMFTKESFKSALEEGLAGAIGGMLGGIVHSRVKEDSSIIPFIASGEYETLQAGLNLAFSKGAISQQQYDGIRARAELLNNLYKDNRDVFAQVAQYDAANQMAIAEGVMRSIRDQNDYVNNTQNGYEDDYNQFVNILNSSSSVQTKDGKSFSISTVDRFEETLRAAGRIEEANLISDSRKDAKAKVKQVSPKPKKFNNDTERLAWLSINKQIEEQMYQFNAQKRINELRSRKLNGEIASLLNNNDELRNVSSAFINSTDFNSKFQEKVDAIKNAKSEQEIDTALKEARSFVTKELTRFNKTNNIVTNVDEWVNKEYALLNMQLDNIANEKKMRDYTLNSEWVKSQQENIAKVFELEQKLQEANRKAEEASKRIKKIADYFSSDEYKTEMDNLINDENTSEEDRQLYKSAKDGDTASQIEVAKRQHGKIVKELNSIPVSEKEAREAIKANLDSTLESIKYLEQKKKDEDEEIAKSIPQPVDANYDGIKDSVVDKNDNAFTLDKKATKRSDKYGFVYTITDKDGNTSEVKEKELLDYFVETTDGESISLAQLASIQETAYKQQFTRKKINLKEGQDENYEITEHKTKLRKDHSKDPKYAESVRLAVDTKFKKIINDPKFDVSKLPIELTISDNIEELNGYAKEKAAKNLFQKLLKSTDPIKDFEELSEVERDELTQYLPIQGIITYKGYKNKIFTFSNASKLKTKLCIELLKNNGKLTLPAGSMSRTPGYLNYQTNTSNNLISGLNLKLKNGEYVFPNGTPVRIGIADAAGGIMYIDPVDDTAEYLVTANAEGTPGSPYLVIPGDYQLTGEEGYVAKLNPSKIPSDLAVKLAQVFSDIQSGKIKLSDKVAANNPYGIIPDKIGYLSYGEFLNYIIYFGENTVTSKREPSKILFFDYKDNGILKFGAKQEPLIPNNADSMASFVRWITTNKNFLISRAFLNNDTPIKNGFKFVNGSLKLDFPTGGRYLNSVIENGLIKTDLDIKQGLISESYLLINNVPTSNPIERTVENDPVINIENKPTKSIKASEISVSTVEKNFKSEMENLPEGTTIIAKVPGSQKYANACGLVKTKDGFVGKSNGVITKTSNLTDSQVNEAIRKALVDDYNHYINGLIKYEEEHPEARETVTDGNETGTVTKHGYLISTKNFVKNKAVDNPKYYEAVKKIKIVPIVEVKPSNESKKSIKQITQSKSITSTETKTNRSNPFATLEQTEQVKKYSDIWDKAMEGFNSIADEKLRLSAIRSLISNPSSAALKLLGITREEAYEFLDYTFPDGNTVSRLLLNGEKTDTPTAITETPKPIKSPVKEVVPEKTEPKVEELNEITKETSPFKLTPLAKDPQVYKDLVSKYSKEMEEMSAEEMREIVTQLNEQVADAIPGFEIYHNIRKNSLSLRVRKEAKPIKEETPAPLVNAPLTPKEMAAKAGITPEDTGEKRRTRKVGGKFGGGKRSKPAAPMTVRENEKQTHNLNREVRLYRQMLGKKAGGKVTIVDKLIRIIGETGRPGWAWSIMNEDGITLFENPAEGATYHEAFHRVSLLLLSPEERNQLYRMARKEYSLYSRSDNEVEEFLAELFRLNVLENAPKAKGFVGRILSNIKEFIKTFLGLNKTKLDNIDGFFNAIKKSKYKYARVNKQSLTAFNNRYANGDAPLTVNGVTLHNIYNSALLNNIVSTLTSMTIDVNGIQNIESLEKGLSFKAVKDQLITLRDKYEIASQNDSFTEWEKAAYQEKVDMYNEILDNFSTVFRPLIDTKLQGFNIRRVENKLADKDDLNDLVNDEIRSAYEFSVKENAQADIRVMFLTLKKSDEYDPDTFLPQYVNPDIAWFNTFSAVHDAKSIDEMLEILAKKADETNTIRQAKGDSSKTNMYSELYDILTATDEDGNVDEMLKTRFWNTFKKHRNKFINAYFANETSENGKKSTSYEIRFGDADINKRSNKIEQNWSTLFAINGTFANKEKLQKAIDDYKALVSKTRKNTFLKTPYEENAIELVRILNSIDIVVDLDTIGILLNNNYFNSNLNIALKNLINGVAKKGYKDPVGLNQLFGESGLLQSLINDDIENVQDRALNLFDKEKSIIELARSYVAANPTAEDDSVIGPDGSLVYAYSENNTITSMFEEWLKDENFYNQMKQVTYSRSSYWLDQMADTKVRDNVHVETMLSMVATDEYDTGRGYLDIAPNEDLLLKFNAVINNKMPLPTLANKRTYYFISGLKRVPVSIQNGQLNDEAIDVFTNYAINEYVVIQEAIKAKNKFLDRIGVSEDVWNKMSGKEQKKLLKEKNTNYKELVENYHYIVKGGSMKLTGNGYKFRYFTSFTDKLNDDKFWDINNSKLRSGINKLLVQQVNNTIKLFINQKLIRGNNKYYDVENVKEKDDTRVNIKAILGNTLLPARLIKGEKTKREDIAAAIADYAINSAVSTLEFEKLVSGDVAYYKGSKDYQAMLDDRVKRYSALTSTKSILREIWPTDYLDFNSHKYRTSVFSSNIVESRVMYDEMMSKYVGTDDNHGLLWKQFEKFKKDGVGRFATMTDEQLKEEVVKEADKRLSKYLSTDQTDAQVLISPKMFRKLAIMNGEWNEEKEEAYNLMESDEPLSLEDELYAYSVIMQPLKYIHFGYDFINGLQIPIYDKMSLATVFKRIAVGRDLQKVREFMDTNDVDMVKFETAVKSGLRQKGTFYEDGKPSENLNDIPVFEQSFKYLGKQLVTDPHHVSRIALGTQMVKIGVAGVEDDVIYEFNGKQYTGAQIINDYVEAIARLSDLGRERILSDFGLSEVTENGKTYMTLERDKFVEMLKDDAINSNMPSNLIDALKTIENDNGSKDYYVDLSGLPALSWIQSRIVSMIKKETIDVNTPGGSMIQMSNFAFKNSYVEVDTSKYEYKFNKELRFKDENNRLQAVVSINLFKDVLPKQYLLEQAKQNNTTYFDEAKKFILENPDLAALSYRIPTQGMNSTLPITVVDVLPANVGDTIILPAELTTLTGADFDVDKMYLARYNYEIVGGKLHKIEFVDDIDYIDEFGNPIQLSEDEYLRKVYDYKRRWYNSEFYNQAKSDIPAILTSVIADTNRNGEITEESMDVLQSMLQKYEVFIDKRAFNSILKNKKLKPSKKIAILSETFVFADEGQTFEEFKETNKGKSKWELNNSKQIENRLLDIFQTTLTSKNHYMDATVPLDFATDALKDAVKVVDGFSNINKNYKDTEPLFPLYQENVKTQNVGADAGIGPMALINTFRVIMQISKLKIDKGIDLTVKRGKHRYKRNLVRQLSEISELYNKFDVNGVSIMDWTSALINAHVDAAKDSYITRLNVNSYTYDVVALLTSAGVGINQFYFLSQPVLKQIAEESIRRSSAKIGLSKKEKMDRRWVEGIISRFEKNAKMPKNWFEKLNDGELTIEWKGEQRNVSELIFDEEWLQKQLEDHYKGNLTPEWYRNQVILYEYFKDIQSYSKALSNLVLASQVDTGKMGKNEAEIILSLHNIEKCMDDPHFLNADEVFSKTFLGRKLNNSANLLFETLRNEILEFSPGFINLTNTFGRFSNTYFDRKPNNINKYMSEMKFAIQAEFFNEYCKQNNISIKDMFYGDNTIVDRMARLRSQILSGVKYQDLADNELIKMLIPGLNREGKPKKFETVMKLRDSASKDAYTYAWRDLLEYRNKEVRDLAKDLILYSFYTSGGRGTGVYATLDLVPFEVLSNMSYINNGVDYTYNQYLRDVMQRSRNNALDAEKYLEYAFKALQDSEDIVQSAITSRKSYIVDSQEKDGKIVYFTTEFDTFNTSDGLPSPFLKIGDDLYKYVGMKTNSSESYPVYALTNSINFKERGFSINEGTLTSSFDENQREDTTDLHIPFNEKFIGDANFTARNAFTQNPTETPVVDYTSLDEEGEGSTQEQQTPESTTDDFLNATENYGNSGIDSSFFNDKNEFPTDEMTHCIK